MTMRRPKIYVPSPDLSPVDLDVGSPDYDNVARTDESLSSESDLADSPAGQTIRSSYKSPMFDQKPLEPCPVNGCPLNPHSGVNLYSHCQGSSKGREGKKSFLWGSQEISV